ncbi:MAG: DNA-3-methyladenine glycosylase 2 family protein [Frankiales bacterium]|nr:DNA-3-methyladenine glycosylase 2 family protein [Frankiales bacterium]
MTDGITRVWTPSWPVSLGLTLGGLRRGSGDPTYQRDESRALWRTMRTPDGPATQRLAVSAGTVISTSWGPGAAWAAERLPRMLGVDDDVSGFDPSPHPLVAEQWRRVGAGMRTPAVGCVVEQLVAAVLEQRVTGLEARRAWRWLLTAHGEPAPGPGPAALRVFPAPDVLARVPSWEWHRAGVDGSRAATVMRVAGHAGRLEECDLLPLASAHERMRALPGVGVWTAAEVASRSLGDADAVSFGDFHVAQDVVFALTGETDGTDARLAEVLAPWPGHRGRVVRLVELTGISRPARGPRYSPKDFRRM